MQTPLRCGSTSSIVATCSTAHRSNTLTATSPARFPMGYAGTQALKIGSARPTSTPDCASHLIRNRAAADRLVFAAAVRTPAASHRWRPGSIGQLAGLGFPSRRPATAFAFAFAAAIARCEHRFARQVQPPLAIDFGDFNGDLVADVDHVFHALDALRRQLADVHETFLTGKDLHECTDRDNARDGSDVGFADDHLFGEILDDLFGFVAGLAVQRGDVDGSVVLDVDLRHAGIGDDLVDHLAAGADHVFDLGGIDLHHDHARCKL